MCRGGDALNMSHTSLTLFFFNWLPQISSNDDKKIISKTAERPDIELEIIIFK